MTKYTINKIYIEEYRFRKLRKMDNKSNRKCYMYITCILHVYYMYITCILHVINMYITCILHVYYM